MIKRNKKLGAVVAATMCIVAAGCISTYTSVMACADTTESSGVIEQPIKVDESYTTDGTHIFIEHYADSDDTVIWKAKDGIQLINLNQALGYVVNNFHFIVNDNDGTAIIRQYTGDGSDKVVIFPDEVKVNGKSYVVKGLYHDDSYNNYHTNIYYSEKDSFEKVKYSKSMKKVSCVGSGTCKEVEFADGFNYYIGAMYGHCSTVRKVNLSNTVETIPVYAFAECHELKSVIIPKSVTKMCDGGFPNECKNVVILGDNLNIEGCALPRKSTVWVKNSNMKKIVEDSEDKSGAFYHTGDEVNVQIGRPYIESYWNYRTDTTNVDSTDKEEVGIYGVKFAQNADETVSIIGHNYQMKKYYLNDNNHVVLDDNIMVNNVWYKVKDIEAGSFAGCEDCIFEVPTVTMKEMLVKAGIPRENIISTGIIIDIDGITYEKNGDNTVQVKKCIDESAENINIPEKIMIEGKEYQVTQVGVEAFKDCKNLKSIVLPSGITNIDFGAFHNCISLNDVEIPSSVTQLGSEAFGGCTSLTKIVIPSGVASIGDAAFFACTSLSNVTIENGVQSIGDKSFYYCQSLHEISLPDSITSIEARAFLECNNLETIKLPSNLKGIGVEAFRNCQSLKSVSIPEGVIKIEWGAFHDCKNLSDLSMPNTLEEIGTECFAGCTSLTKIVIPSNVSKINGLAFQACSNLSDVTLPDSITTIEKNAFLDDMNATFNVTIDQVKDLLIASGVSESQINSVK